MIALSYYITAATAPSSLSHISNTYCPIIITIIIIIIIIII